MLDNQEIIEKEIVDNVNLLKAIPFGIYPSIIRGIYDEATTCGD